MQTFDDVSAFLKLFFLLLCGFANGLYILNFDGEVYGEKFSENPTFIQFLSNFFDRIWVYLNTIVNQYMLGLGEFGVDSFGDSSNEILMWLLFLFATFITMLVFFNMIIAIMGETFNTVNENWKRSSLIEKT